MRRLLKDVGPHVIHEMDERILTPKPDHTQRHVLHCPTGSLAMYKVPGVDTGPRDRKSGKERELGGRGKTGKGGGGGECDITDQIT